MRAMKKILLILVLLFSVSFDMFFQRSDVFFKTDNDNIYNRISNPDDILNLPSGGLGATNNEPAPIGNGLIILTALGVCYSIRKRNK